MIGKKINQLATELAPVSTDLTIIGNPTTGVSKKITLAQLGAIFSGAVSFYTNLAAFPNPGTIDVIFCAKDTKKLYLWSGSAYVEVFPSQALLDTYQLRSEKGVSNGYASLDSGGKVPISQLPSSIMEYKGTWNAATNTPTLANGTGDTGDVYLCNVAGTVNFGAGPLTFAVGDYVIYSGSIWQRSSGAVGTVTSVGLTITGDSIGITGSPVTTSGTLALAFAGNSTQYVNGAGNLNTFPTLLSSVGLSMPSAFSVANSPLTANGTIAVTGAGNATQYVRGDGQLATLPTNGGGGGASVSYYLNGSINQGTIGGVTYYEMNKTPIIGAGTDFSRSSNGYIASFLTDANDPALLNIPAGNWNFETYFEASSGGGSPTFYIELYQYDGTTFTLIASNSATPKLINDGANIEAYFSALAVPQTTLTLTDRLAVRIYVTTAGRTITLHTENGHLCQVITTFTTGLTALNGLTSQVQYLATGTSGTDFNISSATATHTFNLPTASATIRGALSSADWASFNSKQNAITLTTTGTSGAATLVGATLNIPNYAPDLSGYVPTSRTITINGTSFDLSANRSYSVGTVTSVGLSSATSGVTIGSTPITTSGTITLAIATASGSQQGLLSSTDWTTFNNKQSALTNPVTGTGTTNTLPKFTGASTIGNSLLTDNGTLLNYGNNIITIGASNTAEKYLGINSSTGDFYFGGTSAEHYIYGVGSKAINFYTNGTSKMLLSASGNLGLGVTPSAWWSDMKAIEAQGSSGGVFASASINGHFLTNAYYNGTNWIYKNTAFVSYYSQTSGQHQWLTAPSGTAGNAISFTQAMTLDASGRLIVGATTPIYLKFNVSETSTNRVAILYRGTQAADSSMITTFGTPYLSIGGQENKVDSIQTIGFGFTNGTSYIQPAEIGFQTTSISGYTLGDLVFATRGATTNTAPDVRLRIASTGVATFSSSVTASGITSTGTNTMLSASSSTAGLIVRGGSSIGTASLASGQILVGQTTTYRLSLAYDDNTGYAYIDNLYDNANSNIYFRVRTNGTPINALTLFGTGAATFSSNIESTTGSIKTGEPDTGWGRAAIKIGAKVSGEAFNVDYYLPISVDGTVYYINLNSSTP